jgi:tripartite-type tricarboxylate transporter receptor subunit TctC
MKPLPAHRRRLLQALAASGCGVGLTAAGLPARAQQWPAKPIRIINPWPPGGPADAIARPVIEKASQLLGQQIVMESRSGANGMIGTELVSKASGDGYTLLLSHAGPTAISPALRKNMPYRTLDDFQHITLLAAPTIVLVIRPDLPYRDLQGLIAWGKANPAKLTYGSVGPGSTTHLASVMLEMMSGIKTVHVPYKGAAPVVTDLLGGQLDFAFLGNAAVAGHVQAGKLRLIATASPHRSAVAASTPAVSETLPGFQVVSWYGLAAPAATPAAIVDRVYQAFAAALKDPEVRAKLEQTGSDPGGMSPADFTAIIRSDIDRWEKVVAAAGLPKE